jgi:hypothetical protein
MTSNTDELGTVRWFGRSWGAPVCDPRTHVSAPAGTVCARCDAEIDEDDQGVTMPAIEMVGSEYRSRTVGYHLDCYLGSIGIGPRAHEFCNHEPRDGLIERDDDGGFRLTADSQ